jgi:hypothetical protein
VPFIELPHGGSNPSWPATRNILDKFEVKEIIIVGSYCNTEKKLLCLIDLITKAKKNNMDVLVYGRYPIPEYVQSMCDYWIYDRSNPVFKTDRKVYIWYKNFGKKIIRIVENDWGFAAIEQIIKSLGAVKAFSYEIAYWVNYDVDLTNFQKFKSLCSENFKSYSCVMYPWSNNGIGVCLTAIGFKINESYAKLKGVITKTNYTSIFKSDNFIPEDIFRKMVESSELDYFISEEHTPMGASINSEGERLNGAIPEEFEKTRNYFGRCFIGTDKNTNSRIVYMSSVKEEIKEIVLNFGNDDAVFYDLCLDSYGSTEIKITDSSPNIFLIKSINGNEINELLDADLNDDYFRLNTIENII